MRSTQIKAEKITHPFQLMAAWFVMLIVVISVLLTAAIKITYPRWIAAYLVIFATAFAVLVSGAVFAMLTRFRPNLQGEKEYASWLADERRFRGQVPKLLQIRELPAPKAEISISGQEARRTLDIADEIRTCPVEASPLKRVEDLLASLRRLGFQTSIYESASRDQPLLSVAGHKSIWIGSRISPAVAVLAIKTAVQVWNHLCYLHFSSDAGGPPDYIHDQMYFGGSTSTAEEYGLEAWKKAEIMALPDEMSEDEWKRRVRSKYGIHIPDEALVGE